MSEKENSLNTTYMSNALFISDNVATQIDGFGHIYEGDPPHTYNGFRYEDILSGWGLLKLGIHAIPPIVAPATMIDVAARKVAPCPHAAECIKSSPLEEGPRIYG